MIAPVQSTLLTAGDVRRATGFSYQLLDQWENKGMASQSRKGHGAWRRYQPGAVFALMVCSALRRQFGVPIERLRFVYRRMVNVKRPGFLEVALHWKSAYGRTAWLATDFRKVFLFRSDVEILEWIKPTVEKGGEASLALMSLGPIVDRLAPYIRLSEEESA